MGQPAYESELEVCPNCGEFVPYLNDETGWCDSCSGVAPSIRCDRCSKELEPNYQYRICQSCRYVVWLEKNADEIERVMVDYDTNAAQAKRIVRSNNRPICLSCGNPIRGGTKNVHFFCKKTAACKKAHNSYHYHRRVKRRSHNEAVERALTSAAIVRLTNGTSQRNQND